MKALPKINYPELNADALECLEEVLGGMLELDTKCQGSEFKMLNPRRVDHDFGSFSINSTTGRWADFAEDDERARGGDVISLVAYLRDLSQGQAARQLRDFLGAMADNRGGQP